VNFELRQQTCRDSPEISEESKGFRFLFAFFISPWGYSVGGASFVQET
jgi:hypothetical protein